MSADRRKEEKQRRLRQLATLNPRPEAVTHPLFRGSEFFDSHDLIQVKYEMLRLVSVEKRPVSESAKDRDHDWGFRGRIFGRFAHRFERITKRSEAVMKRLDTLYAGRPFRVLLMSKFIYGTRVLTIIYLSLEKISAIKFLVSNLLGTFVWLSAVVAVGWLAGRSIINLMPMLSDVKYAILIIVILVVGFEFIPKFLQKKKEEKGLVSPHE